MNPHRLFFVIPRPPHLIAVARSDFFFVYPPQFNFPLFFLSTLWVFFSERFACLEGRVVIEGGAAKARVFFLVSGFFFLFFWQGLG